MTKNCWCSIDAPLKLILTVLLCSQIGYQNSHRHYSQYIYHLKYNHLYPKFLCPLNCRSSTRLVIIPLQFAGNLHIVDPSTRFWLIKPDIFTFPKLASAPGNRRSTNKQCSISRLIAPGLSRQLYNWMHASMQYDSCHSYCFILCISSLIYQLYVITDLNYICNFCLYFSFCFFTYQ